MMKNVQIFKYIIFHFVKWIANNPDYPPLNNAFPSLENFVLQTLLVWKFIVFIEFFEWISQILTALSNAPLTNNF